MKNMKVKKYHSRSYLKQKLVSATAMLLIASILMVSASYAWYVMSTAPEVSNIKTQVGANGALEIALLDAQSWENLTLLDSGDIDESVTGSATSANLTWGNLVDLSDSSYGLSAITLQPARLYIEQSGTDTEGTVNYAVNESLLKVPQYGEDGRIQQLTTEGVSAMTYSTEGGAFSNASGYGVRAIGTSADMNQFQLGMNTARQNLSTYMSSARTAASKALSDNGTRLASIASAYALEGKDDYDKNDVATVRALAVGLNEALSDLEAALKQAFAGYITTEASGVMATDYAEKLAAIDGMTLTELWSKYDGITDIIPNMAMYISTLNEDIKKVTTAINDCDTLTSSSATSYSWQQLYEILSPLVDPYQMTLGGEKLNEVKASVKNADGSINFSKAFDLVKGGVVIGVPTGSGILSDIADYAGDYTAKVTIDHIAYGSYSLDNVDAQIATQTSVNPVYLTVCSNKLRSEDTTSADGSNAMTDYYGYALDLAFRTNASGSSLQLQTDSVNRVYEDDESYSSLQGGGSYMKFGTSSTTMSATKMIKLMSAIRVVLMDKDRNILGIATLDTTIGQKDYTVIANGTSDAYAYLDIGGNYQQSDVISEAQYTALAGKTSALTIDKNNRTISAKLYLHEFSMTESKATHTDAQIEANKNSNTFYTGGITIGDKKADGTITALTEDTAMVVTALVYLDGSTVTNATVSADSLQSMTGVLNLQFSSSATLLPAENTALRNIGGEVTYTKAANAGATYYFNGTKYTVAEGYTIYAGSDNKVYYQASDTTGGDTTTGGENTEGGTNTGGENTDGENTGGNENTATAEYTELKASDIGTVLKEISTSIGTTESGGTSESGDGAANESEQQDSGSST